MEIAINNAGIIIMGPFFPQLFERLNLTENDSFVNYEAQNRAVYLLQYLVYDQIDFPEHEFPLNNLLVGLAVEDPITQIYDITDHEKGVCTSLIQALIANWEKMRNSSQANVQGSFFQREGLLKIENDNILQVQKKGFDILISFIPWNISVLKFPWMDKPLKVEWL